MKETLFVMLTGALLILAGCKDNPVAPPAAAPAPRATAAEVNGSAVSFYAQGKDVITAATALCSQYHFGTDTLVGSLYRAGYSTRDLVSALKIVFKLLPRACEVMMHQTDPNQPSEGIADLILRAYVDSLLQRPEDLIYFLRMVQSIERSVRILDSLYAYSPADVMKTLHPLYPDIVCTVKAIRAVYPVEFPKIAAMLDQLGFALGDVPGILRSSGCSLDELAGILKDHYAQSAAQAAGYLRVLSADFPAIANALRNHYTLAFVDIALILKNVGGKIDDIVPVLFDLSESLQGIINDLKLIGFSPCDVMHYFNVPC